MSGGKMGVSTPVAEPQGGFCARPPSCLVLMEDQSVGGIEEARRGFADAARDLQIRMRELLSQVRIEVGVFLRLMYKNKNQHRRSLYYRRLSGVKRDLQTLGSSGLEETVEAFVTLCAFRKPDGLSRKPGGFSKTSILEVKNDKRTDGTEEQSALCVLLSVARLLCQVEAPIIAASVEIAGLLAQSFFVPFALTIFSSLARFRVLLAQVLYEVITAFNLLSANLKLNYPKSIGVICRGLPAELECRWDDMRLSMIENKPHVTLESIDKDSNGPAEPAALWFVDDRTGVMHDLRWPINLSSSGEQKFVNLQESSHVYKDTGIVNEMVNAQLMQPLTDEAFPDESTIVPAEDIEKLDELKDAKLKGQNGHSMTTLSDQALTRSEVGSKIKEISTLKELSLPSSENLGCSSGRCNSPPRSEIRKSVSYISISHKFDTRFKIKGSVGHPHNPQVDSQVNFRVQGEMKEPEVQVRNGLGSQDGISVSSLIGKNSLRDTNLPRADGHGVPVTDPRFSLQKILSHTSKQDLHCQGGKEEYEQISAVIPGTSAVAHVLAQSDDRRKPAFTNPDGADGVISNIECVGSSEKLPDEILDESIQRIVPEETICPGQLSNSFGMDCQVMDAQAEGHSTIVEHDSNGVASSCVSEFTLNEEMCGSSIAVGVDNKFAPTSPDRGHVLLSATTTGRTGTATYNLSGQVESAKEKQDTQNQVMYPDPSCLGAIVPEAGSARVVVPHKKHERISESSTVTVISFQQTVPNTAIRKSSSNLGSVNGKLDRRMTGPKIEKEAGLIRKTGLQSVGKQDHEAEKNVQKIPRISDIKAQKANRRQKRSMASASIDLDVRASGKRRKKDDRGPALSKGKVHTNSVSPIAMSAAESKIQVMSRDDNLKKSSKSELKKESIDDIFKMLIG